MIMKKLKTISKKIVYSHPWETVVIEKVLTDKNKVFEYLISKPNPFVIIIIENEIEQVLFLKQYKHGSKKIMLGFPAGYINTNESPRNAAKRELREETGLKISKLKKIACLYENPTRSPNKFYVYYAIVKQSILSDKENVDELEGRVEFLWRRSEVNSLINISREITSGPMLSALQSFITYKTSYFC